MVTQKTVTQKDEKQIDTKKVVDYLNYTFANVTKTMGRDARTFDKAGRETTPLYLAQVNFSYLINEIQRGPKCMLPRVIAEANDLIKNLSVK